MRWLRRLWYWSHFRARQDDLREELAFHHELRAAELLRQGLGPDDAEATARRAMGNATYMREAARAVWLPIALDGFMTDVRQAWRGLCRTPVFTLTVVLVLSLGLGANAALFSLIDRIFLQAPAMVGTPREVRRLYYVRPSEALSLAPGGVYERTMYFQYAAIRDAASGHARFAAYVRPDSVDARVGVAVVPVMTTYVTQSYFSVLRVRPEFGRFFAADEGRVDVASPVAVISDGLWHRQFGGLPSVIGKQLTIDGHAFMIVGVAPPAFSGIDLDRVDVWLPLGALRGPAILLKPWYQSGYDVLRIIARVSSDDAARQLASIATLAYRHEWAAFGVQDTTARVLTGPIIGALGPAGRLQAESISLRLSGVAFVLLLIACANVANMLLVRATRRRREIAIRRALGISRGRLAGQLMIEGLVLSAVSAVVATFVGIWGSSVLRALLMPGTRWASDFGHLHLFIFATVAGAMVGPLGALAAALGATGLDLSEALKTGDHAARHERAWVRTSLLVGQAALSIALLIGAGLFLRSLSNVRAIDLGFDTRGLIAVGAHFRDPARKTEVAPALEDVAAQIAGLPDVERVAMASSAPMLGGFTMMVFRPTGDSLPGIDGAGPVFILAAPDYFVTVGVKMLAGRLFDSTDRVGNPGVAVVNATMARSVWPGESALGKCIKVEKRSASCTTVIGVVEDTHFLDIVQREQFMQLYVPLAQHLDLESDRMAPWGRMLLVRARSDDDADLVSLLRRAMHQRLPDVDLLRVDDMQDVLGPQMRPWRLGATLFTLMSALAALVAAIGVYGVIAFAVSQRTHEMGVRIALGAQWSDIIGLIVGEGVRVVAVGILVGVGFAIALGRLVASLLYGVSPHDPLVVIGACALLGGIGIVASLLPALRASRLDPAYSLRAE